MARKRRAGTYWSDDSLLPASEEDEDEDEVDQEDEDDEDGEDEESSRFHMFHAVRMMDRGDDSARPSDVFDPIELGEELTGMVH